VLLFKACLFVSQYRKWLCAIRGCNPDAVLATSSIRMQTRAFDLSQVAFMPVEGKTGMSASSRYCSPPRCYQGDPKCSGSSLLISTVSPILNWLAISWMVGATPFQRHPSKVVGYKSAGSKKKPDAGKLRLIDSCSAKRIVTDGSNYPQGFCLTLCDQTPSRGCRWVHAANVYASSKVPAFLRKPA
jgi:hypothetical protein